ncbi:Txe/YoeB family addiction module toxin [Streptomyces apocyni]|uniref:Txe/YoeB family addiction module toxin n=1 Tax=Streptomyces apocyni TaxID=2654677 RepID=UPI0012E9D51A|nr:Txe/YoeB family addiction module toxin [Streptomyces apocyni]
MRDVRFRPSGWDDLLYWQSTDKKLFRNLVRLIGEVQRDPFTGIGKPEPLKGDLSGYWSRRIDDEHRFVYRATEKEVVILKARYRY